MVSLLANLEPYVTMVSPAEHFSVYEGKAIQLSANAFDLDGTISLIEFFDGTGKIGDATTRPYNFTWAGGSMGDHFITAKATDNEGAVKTSAAISIRITQAPPCNGGPASGDYTYQFSTDKNNPTLTFIPGTAGVGNPTCILYYGTSTTGPFPGYNVTPGTPYRITAGEGINIYFYYTYSYPGAGERNTMTSKHSYEIGSCSAGSTGIPEMSSETFSIFPNPVTDKLTLNNPGENAIISLYSINGKLLIRKISSSTTETIDVRGLPMGIYIINVAGSRSNITRKLIKNQ